MKLFLKILFIYFVCTQMLFSSEINLTNKEKEFLQKHPIITLGSDSNWSPYIIKNEDNTISGYDTEILKMINEATGANFNLVTGKWKDILENAKNRQIDGLSTSAVHEERVKYFNFSDTYVTTQRLIVISNLNPKNINSFDDLKGKRIAYQKDNLFDKKLLAKYKDSIIVPLDSLEEILDSLIKGDIDATIGSHVIIYLAQKKGLPFIKILDKLDNSKLNLVFSIRNDYPEALSILNKGLKAISFEEKVKLQNKWFFQSSKKIDKTIELSQKEIEYLENKKILRVQNLSTFPPFNFNENEIPLGYTIDYMNLIADYLDIDLKFISGKPWKEYLQMLKNNEIDIIPHIAVNEERKTFIDFTNFNHIEYVTGLAVRKGTDFKTMSDLKDKVIAVANKTFLHTHLKNKFPNQKLLLTSSTSSAVQTVSEGKADAVIGSLPVLQYYIHKNWLTNIETININGLGLNKITKMPMGVAKGNDTLKSILEKANYLIPYNKVSELKEKWLNINVEEKNENLVFSNAEKNYLRTKENIKICVLPDWLPFEQIDEDGNHKGIGADILKIISKKIDKEFVLVPTNQWSKSLQNIRDRKCDILPVAMDIPSRRDAMDFTKPYVSEPFVIATKSDKFFIKDEKELSYKKIGVVASYAFIEVLKSKNPNIQIVEVKNTKEGLEKVSSEELFAYIDTMPTIGYFIQKYGMLDLKIAGKLDYDITLSIASRNDEPHLNSIMQKSLNTISEDKIRAIVGGWIKIKVEQSFDYTKLLYTVVFFTIIIFLILYKNRSINLINKKLKEEQKKIESLTHSQQSLLSLFDKGDAVLFKWKITNKLNVEFISESIYGLTGFTQDDFISGRVSYSECIHKEDLNIVKQKNKKALKEKSLFFKHEPYRVICKDGVEKWVLDYRVAEKNGDDILYLLGYISDITEHIKNQENISHQTKMVSLGEMIGNIAHQWRQPLSLISSVATGSLLQKEMNLLTDKDFKKNMNLINDNVQYLSKTIDDFRNFIKGNRDLVKFNLSEKIDSFLNLVQPSILNNKIEIIKECDSSIQLVNYPNDLMQSLINIYNNAKDALKELPEEERYFFINTKIEDDKVVIILKDNGKGISVNMLKKVFEPYTTTKHQSQGTGLGLNITYNFIVTGMEGSIDVKNSKYVYKGKEFIGAEITIKLPLEE